MSGGFPQKSILRNSKPLTQSLCSGKQPRGLRACGDKLSSGMVCAS